MLEMLSQRFVLEQHQLELPDVNNSIFINIKSSCQTLGLLQRDVQASSQLCDTERARLVGVDAEEEALRLLEEGVLLRLLRRLFAPFLEEVVPLVVHNHKCWEVLHFNLPHSLHPELFHVKHLHLLDAVGTQRCRHTTDGAQVETAVLLARVCHFPGPVSLPDHDHGASPRLEFAHILVHPSRRRWTEGSGRHPRWSLCRACVVHRVLLDVLWQSPAIIDHLLHLGMGNVPRHNDGTRQRKPSCHGVLAQQLQVVRHWVVQVHLDDLTSLQQSLFFDVWQILGRI
mmetsp:Transcript_32588/g.58512  ORF Transcript_32588/g.58512 Transcript_32588/m.58512 type:complete len:285 (-) Transcript_32588:801-1655(-)